MMGFKTTSGLKLKSSWEYREFEKWCEQNNRMPMKLIKKYCRFTVLYGGDLTEKM